MPPKRKRTEEATTAVPRATRASTRKKSDVDSDDTISKAGGSTNEVPAAKRAKKAPTKSTKSKSSKSSATERASEDQSTTSNKLNDTNGSPLPSHAVNSAKPAKSGKTSQNEPYSPERVTDLFDTYADADDASVIGADGFIQLCADAGIAMEGSLPLLLHWLLNAEDMMKIQKSEWDKGMSELRISSLTALLVALNDFEQLLIENQPALKPPVGTSSPVKKKTATTSEPYNRARYYACAADSNSFDELYKYCFNLPKTDKRVRNIEMETATAFWSVLLLPQYPLIQDILDFINEKKDTYKGVNKDLWLMILEFCRTMPPTLQDYDADGAWPTMLDDFVSWKRRQIDMNNGAMPSND